MIIIKDGKKITGNYLSAFTYVEKSFLSRFILMITRYLRARSTLKYIVNSNNDTKLLDIGCGDGYFLKKAKCNELYGLDKLIGDVVEDKLEFPDNYFDYVTMLAVVEHLDHTEEIIDEIWRVLKPGGKLIITTPKNIAKYFIKLYIRSIEKEHKTYFDLQRIETLTKGKLIVLEYKTFLFGLNQIICLEKGNNTKKDIHSSR